MRPCLCHMLLMALLVVAATGCDPRWRCEVVVQSAAPHLQSLRGADVRLKCDSGVYRAVQLPEHATGVYRAKALGLLATDCVVVVTKEGFREARRLVSEDCKKMVWWRGECALIQSTVVLQPDLHR